MKNKNNSLENAIINQFALIPNQPELFFTLSDRERRV